MKFLPTLLLTFLYCLGYGQQYTLSGYIKDASSGEGLIGVSVFVEELGQGTTTNVYGFYSLTLNQGSYKVKYSYVELLRISKYDQKFSLFLNFSCYVLYGY